MNGIEHEYIDLILEQIVAEKEVIITRKCKELSIYESYAADPFCRFKRFMLEKLHDGIEKLWYDDGTESGKLIVCIQTHVAHDGKGRVGFQVIELEHGK